MAIFMVVVFEKGALGWKSSYPIVMGVNLPLSCISCIVAAA